MNRIRLAWSLSVAVLALTGLSGCSMFNPRVGATPEAEKIGVYEAYPPGNRNYRKVVRLWVEPWSSAFSVPHYSSVEAGAADLRNHAVAYGGDAVVNFGCYRIAVDPQSALVCNGTVIRYMQ
jgi:hypothetical protein